MNLKYLIILSLLPVVINSLYFKLVPSPRPGTCPAYDDSDDLCDEECQNDSECPGKEKCCPTSCGNICESNLKFDDDIGEDSVQELSSQTKNLYKDESVKKSSDKNAKLESNDKKKANNDSTVKQDNDDDNDEDDDGDDDDDGLNSNIKLSNRRKELEKFRIKLNEKIENENQNERKFQRRRFQRKEKETCPVVKKSKSCKDEEDDCDSDNDCTLGKKCCQAQCGKTCMASKLVKQTNDKETDSIAAEASDDEKRGGKRRQNKKNRNRIRDEKFEDYDDVYDNDDEYYDYDMDYANMVNQMLPFVNPNSFYPNQYMQNPQLMPHYNPHLNPHLNRHNNPHAQAYDALAYERNTYGIGLDSPVGKFPKFNLVPGTHSLAGHYAQTGYGYPQQYQQLRHHQQPQLHHQQTRKQ